MLTLRLIVHNLESVTVNREGSADEPALIRRTESFVELFAIDPRDIF